MINKIEQDRTPRKTLIRFFELNVSIMMKYKARYSKVFLVKYLTLIKKLVPCTAEIIRTIKYKKIAQFKKLLGNKLSLFNLRCKILLSNHKAIALPAQISIIVIENGKQKIKTQRKINITLSKNLINLSILQIP